MIPRRPIPGRNINDSDADLYAEYHEQGARCSGSAASSRNSLNSCTPPELCLLKPVPSVDTESSPTVPAADISPMLPLTPNSPGPPSFSPPHGVYTVGASPGNPGPGLCSSSSENIQCEVLPGALHHSLSTSALYTAHSHAQIDPARAPTRSRAYSAVVPSNTTAPLLQQHQGAPMHHHATLPGAAPHSHQTRAASDSAVTHYAQSSNMANPHHLVQQAHAQHFGGNSAAPASYVRSRHGRSRHQQHARNKSTDWSWFIDQVPDLSSSIDTDFTALYRQQATAATASQQPRQQPCVQQQQSHDNGLADPAQLSPLSPSAHPVAQQSLASAGHVPVSRSQSETGSQTGRFFPADGSGDAALRKGYDFSKFNVYYHEHQ